MVSDELEIAFWMKVKSSRDSCWIWDGARDEKGYGRLSASRNAGPQKAHRLSWCIHFGEIPDGLSVMHKCDNRACVRPDHLCLGSHGNNMADRNSKRRQASGSRHGHAKLTAEQVIEIRALRLAGVSPKEIAQRFGISAGYVPNIMRRLKWRDT